MVALHRYVNDIPGLFKYWIGWFAKMERLDLIQEFWNFKPGGWDIRYREENGAMVVEVQRPYTNWEIYGSFPKADDLGFMAPESD